VHVQAVKVVVWCGQWRQVGCAVCGGVCWGVRAVGVFHASPRCVNAHVQVRSVQRVLLNGMR